VFARCRLKSGAGVNCAERRPVSGRAQVFAAGAFADGQDVVVEQPGEDQPGQPRQPRGEDEQQRPGRVPLEGEQEGGGQQDAADEHQLRAAPYAATARGHHRRARDGGLGRGVLVGRHVGREPGELEPAPRAETNFV
jgi:hypothetical protein